MVYYVYILQCCDGSYYTGYTNNLQERTRQHLNGTGARYTKAHKPDRIAYVENYETRSQAMKREREIKKLSHQKKLDLIVSQGKK
ncbi:MAG TPA: GIY-YIG nuclease family protein [Candidatus Deferrimicrobiaceae bacterium]|nr:GIY-YIG nuclease family protein [Candidatus Deferrimicrobiaceae bacterium]